MSTQQATLREAMKRLALTRDAFADRLGVSRRALYDKMRDYGLDGEASAMRTEAGIMGPRKVELDGDADE